MTEKQKGEAEYGIWNEDCSFCRRAEKNRCVTDSDSRFPKQGGRLFITSSPISSSPAADRILNKQKNRGRPASL